MAHTLSRHVKTFQVRMAESTLRVSMISIGVPSASTSMRGPPASVTPGRVRGTVGAHDRPGGRQKAGTTEKQQRAAIQPNTKRADPILVGIMDSFAEHR